MAKGRGKRLAWAGLPITVAGKIGKSLDGTLGGGEGRVHLRTDDGSITIR